ncbi:13800_t:CDS:2, partial [Cetraspora pellucida]
MAIPDEKTMQNINTPSSLSAKPINKLSKSNNDVDTCVFNSPTNEKKLYSLFKEHVITGTEINKIKQYYVTALDLVFNHIK